MSSRRLLATITLVFAVLAAACSGSAGESAPLAPGSSTSVGPRSDEPTSSQPSSSPPPTTVATTDPSPWLEPVAAWQADNDVVGASVLVVDQTGKLSHVVVGFTDIQAQDPTEPQDRFRIGSITKVYTAALVLALAEDGLLDLDDSASAFVPALPEEITIGLLLSHTSGLRDVDVATGIFQAIEAGGLPEPSGDAVLETLDRGLAFEPGTRQAYSSVGFIAIERVIETVTGQAWDIVLAERILATGSGTELEQPDSGIPTP